MSGPSTLRTVRHVRRDLYKTARVLGDVTAVGSGRYPQRVARRVAYREWNRFLRRALRSVKL